MHMRKHVATSPHIMDGHSLIPVPCTSKVFKDHALWVLNMRRYAAHAAQRQQCRGTKWYAKAESHCKRFSTSPDPSKGASPASCRPTDIHRRCLHYTDNNSRCHI